MTTTSPTVSASRLASATARTSPDGHVIALKPAALMAARSSSRGVPAGVPRYHTATTGSAAKLGRRIQDQRQRGRDRESSHGRVRAVDETARSGSIEAAILDAGLFNRSQGHWPAVRRHEPGLPSARVRAHPHPALASRVADATDSADRPMARQRKYRWRRAASRLLHAARRYARHDHGFPGRRAAGRRRVRQLSRPADDRRAGHGVSAPEHAQLLALPRQRPGDGRGVPPARRSGQLRMDVVSAIGRHRDIWPDGVARRNADSGCVVAPRLDQHHRHHPAAARAGTDDDASAVLRVDAARDVIPVAPGVSGTAGRVNPAVDGSARGHELLPADRPGDFRRAVGRAAAGGARSSGSTCSGSSPIPRCTS